MPKQNHRGIESTTAEFETKTQRLIQWVIYICAHGTKRNIEKAKYNWHQSNVLAKCALIPWLNSNELPPFHDGKQKQLGNAKCFCHAWWSRKPVSQSVSLTRAWHLFPLLYLAKSLNLEVNCNHTTNISKVFSYMIGHFFAFWVVHAWHIIII